MEKEHLIYEKKIRGMQKEVSVSEIKQLSDNYLNTDGGVAQEAVLNRLESIIQIERRALYKKV